MIARTSAQRTVPPCSSSMRGSHTPQQAVAAGQQNRSSRTARMQLARWARLQDRSQTRNRLADCLPSWSGQYGE
jgi:hypothetical protein